jgi:hypothetical protein
MKEGDTSHFVCLALGTTQKLLTFIAHAEAQSNPTYLVCSPSKASTGSRYGTGVHSSLTQGGRSAGHAGVARRSRSTRRACTQALPLLVWVRSSPTRAVSSMRSWKRRRVRWTVGPAPTPERSGPVRLFRQESRHRQHLGLPASHQARLVAQHPVRAPASRPVEYQGPRAHGILSKGAAGQRRDP